MTKEELKKLLIKRVQLINNNALLEKMYAAFEKADKKSQPVKRLTVKELLARDEKSMKDFRAGRTISMEEVKKRFAKKK